MGEWRRRRRRRNKKKKSPPKIKKLKKGPKKEETVWHGQFFGGYSVILIYGEGVFGWSEYYLIPMMEVKARKKRELSAEPVGKTHRCISRYIRALGEKHEPSTAFNSIHTSLSLPLSPPLSLPLSFLPLFFYLKISFQKGCKARALSLSVAVAVRKRRIRAHLQQRVKT